MLLMNGEMNRLANLNHKAKTKNLNVMYKQTSNIKAFQPGNNPGRIRSINNIEPASIDQLNENLKPKINKLKASSSLPAIRHKSKVDENKMINIFDESNLNYPNALENKISTLIDDK